MNKVFNFEWSDGIVSLGYIRAAAQAFQPIPSRLDSVGIYAIKIMAANILPADFFVFRAIKLFQNPDTVQTFTH
jgi:hypothetical protein